MILPFIENRVQYQDSSINQKSIGISIQSIYSLKSLKYCTAIKNDFDSKMDFWYGNIDYDLFNLDSFPFSNPK